MRKLSKISNGVNKQISIAIIMAVVVIGGAFYYDERGAKRKTSFPFSPSEVVTSSAYFSSPKTDNQRTFTGSVNQVLAAKFEVLSKNGNSSCSGTFRDSIYSMPDGSRLQGSCCSPMSIHRYTEQVEGLEKFKANLRPLDPSTTLRVAVRDSNGDELGASKIPDDPYDIEARLAKELLSYYDLELTPDEQKAYDYAMLNSSEKGPCCCKCWRWYVYGGLGKLLIRQYGFTGEQVTEVWNLSDGCGGEDEHHHG